MPNSRPLVLALALVTRSAFAADPVSPHLPPSVPGAEPNALARSPMEDRRPLELIVQGRAFAPLAAATRDGGAHGTALGAGAGVGFRQSPYFSLGAEGAVLRASAPVATMSLELAATGRVYLLEAGISDPYLELALGYEAASSTTRSSSTLIHGPSARAGLGLDWVVASPLRLGVLVAYREVLSLPASSCTLGCSVRAHGGLLAGITVTLPLGEPL